MGELHAKLGVGSGTWEVTTRCESCAMERTRLRYPWAAAGPAGQRADAPSESRGADGERAGRPRGGRRSVGATNNAERPPPTSTPSSPAQWPGPTEHATPATPHTTPAQPPGYAKGAGTEVPAPCRLTQPLPRRGLRPDDRQSLRRRRIHRNMPPTTAAPRPAPPIRPSKPVRARPRFGLVAGTSGAT